LKLGFVLVNKHVNNLFFKRVSNGHGYINPDGGTVIDRGMTCVDEWVPYPMSALGRVCNNQNKRLCRLNAPRASAGLLVGMTAPLQAKRSGQHAGLPWVFSDIKKSANFTRALQNILPRSWTSYGNDFDPVVDSVTEHEVNKRQSTANLDNEAFYLFALAFRFFSCVGSVWVQQLRLKLIRRLQHKSVHFQSQKFLQIFKDNERIEKFQLGKFGTRKEVIW
jgi:hypothetical protein